MSIVAPDLLALQRLYHWEKTAPTRIAMTQPMSGGVVQDFTWAQVGDQVRRMAAHLQSQGWEPGSKVAILSKNCAWWMMTDLAIWMAGYVSVPLYPTLAAETVRQILTHSDSRACFVGKLDGWESMKPGVPAGLPCISYPPSPPDVIRSHEGWDAICQRSQPCSTSMRSTTCASGRYESMRSSPVMGMRLRPASSAQAKLPKVCITPLGMPVVPEV